MSEIIYGVDISKKVTPIQARDALIECFYKAHKDLILKYAEIPKEDQKKFTRNSILSIVKSQFEAEGNDFDKPTKESLFKVLIELTKIAESFRDVDIIVKHMAEIFKILDKL